MKNTKIKNRKLWICIISAILVLGIAFGVAISGQAGSQVTTKIDKAQAQEIVDDALKNLAKPTASGAVYLLGETTVTVEEIAYGNNKNIILVCSYSAPNVESGLSSHINDVMAEVYQFYLENENEGKKTNATKVNIQFKNNILTYLESAEPVSGQVTLNIYETANGLQLHLDKEMVNTITGGLLAVSETIKNTNTIEYNGQSVDITNKNTLRTGILDCIILQNYSSEVPLTGNPMQNALADFKDEFHRNFIEGDRYMYLLQGLGTTLSITFLSALMGIGIGIIVALVRCTRQLTGKLKFLDKICQVYLALIRGTPVMVQLLILFFVFLLPMGVEKFPAAVICFGLNSGAYVAEIVRGGITSVDKGQIEAGRSLGFTYVQTMVHFVIPQAFKAILPALANEFITLLKESSVAFYIGIADLTQGGLKIRSITYSNFMPLIAVALIYLVLVLVLTELVGILERRLAKSDH